MDRKKEKNRERQRKYRLKQLLKCPEVYKQKCASKNAKYRKKKELGQTEANKRKPRKIIIGTEDCVKKLRKVESARTSLVGEEVFVMIKHEEDFDTRFSDSIESVSFCRCCFKLLREMDIQHPLAGDVSSYFQDIIQLKLQISSLASTFCDECYNSICSFYKFRNLAVAKQQKFNEMLINDSGDFTEINQIQLTLDPLKDETAEKSIIDEVKNVEFPFECETKVSTRKLALKLKANRSNKQPEQCSICPKKFLRLQNHMIKCHGIKCEWCDYVTADKDLLEIHRESKHKSQLSATKSTDSKISCPHCGLLYLIKHLKTHIERVHEKIKNFWCDMCEYGTYCKTTLSTHILTHLPKSYKCSSCNFSTHSDKKLQKHKKRNHLELPKIFKCHECSEILRSKASLDSHVSRKHRKIRNFLCNDCGKSFFTPKEVKTHHANKHGEKLEVCEFCGSAFGTRKCLEDHKVMHKEATLSCDICNKKFPIKERLDKHIKRLHLKKLNFQCKECDRKFFGKFELRSHLLTHRGIKFNCFVPGCSSSVSRRDALVSHLKSNHTLLSKQEKEDYMRKLNDFYATAMSQS